MAGPLPAPGQEIKDFTDVGDRILFRIGDQVFEGVDDLPVELALEYGARAEELERDDLPIQERIGIIHDMFRLVLKPESADRFIARMRDPEHPVGGRRLKAILPWLFEQYSDRPTTSDEDSSDSSENQQPGTKSLGTQPDGASTSDGLASVNF